MPDSTMEPGGSDRAEAQRREGPGGGQVPGQEASDGNLVPTGEANSEAAVIKSGPKTVALPTAWPAAASSGGRSRRRLTATLTIMAVIIVLLILAVIFLSFKVASQHNTAAITKGSPAPKITITKILSSPSSAASSALPTVSNSSQPTGQAAGSGQQGVTTLYQNHILTIPPLAGGCGIVRPVAQISFMPPPGVSIHSNSGDLSYDACGSGWSSNDNIAALGQNSGSYQGCKTALTNSPMNLQTETVEQGQGYCIDL